jgi:HEAT repeat protein
MEKRLAAIEPAWTAGPKATGRPVSVERHLEALRAAEPAAREAAAKALGESGATEAIPSLRELLGDEDKVVRSVAAVALARLGYRAMLTEMIKSLSDPNPRSVAGTALALGLSRRPEAVEPLLAAFKTHNTAVGSAIAGALGMIGDPRAIPPLLEALKADFVPADACDALAKLGDAKAVPVLLKTLKHRDEKVRARAARALGGLKAQLCTPDAAPTREKAIGGLRKLLTDPAQKLRLAAAMSLHELGDREASGQIVAVLREAT